MCVWLGRREGGKRGGEEWSGRGGMEWEGRERREREVERGRKEEKESRGERGGGGGERRKQVQWGGRGMGNRNQGVIGTSVKVHHRGQSAPQGSKCTTGLKVQLFNKSVTGVEECMIIDKDLQLSVSNQR